MSRKSHSPCSLQCCVHYQKYQYIKKRLNIPAFIFNLYLSMSNDCPVDTHDAQRIKYLCLDTKCQHSNKIGCADCFLENHICPSGQSHQRILINRFQTELAEKVAQVSNAQIAPILPDTQILDQEFSQCLQQLTSRLASFKDSLQSEIFADVQEFDGSLKKFKDGFREIVSPLEEFKAINIVTQDPQRIKQAIEFYQNSDQVSDKFRKQIEAIESQRGKVQNKKQKIVAKLYQTVEHLIKELDEYTRPKPVAVPLTPAQQGTPEKPSTQPTQSLFLSGSSSTHSPPIKNLVEVARSRPKKQYPIAQKKVSVAQKKANGTE